MTPHSSTLVWKIPWTEEPGGLQSMGSLRVGHDWATSLSLFSFMHWRRKWQPTPVFLPGESQGWRSLVGCRLWGRTESDTTAAAAGFITGHNYTIPGSLMWFTFDLSKWKFAGSWGLPGPTLEKRQMAKFTSIYLLWALVPPGFLTQKGDFISSLKCYWKLRNSSSFKWRWTCDPIKASMHWSKATIRWFMAITWPLVQ